MKDRQIKISIVIPVYNETKRLENLYKINNFFKKKKYLSEILVVNDGSNNITTKLLNKLSKEIEFNLIYYKENKGKGHAVKTGMLAANGNIHIFTDLDLSVAIENIDNFITDIERFPVVIGSRRKRNSKIIIHQSSIRELMGRVFTNLSKIVLGLSISDFTCGFKCFSKESSQKIFSNVSINGWGFDSETLFLAKKYGFKIKEIPVKWKNDSESKVKFPGAIFTSFYELIRIRSNQLRGFYEDPKD